MEIYVEGVHDGEDGIVTNFEDKILAAAKTEPNGYKIRDLINDMSRFAIKKMGTAFAECIEEMFEIDDYGLSEEKQKELKSDLYGWINDTNYDIPEGHKPC